MKKLLYCEGGQTLELLAAQRDCEPSTLGSIKKVTGCGPEQPPLADSPLSGCLD